MQIRTPQPCWFAVVCIGCVQSDIASAFQHHPPCTSASNYADRDTGGAPSLTTYDFHASPVREEVSERVSGTTTAAAPQLHAAQNVAAGGDSAVTQQTQVLERWNTKYPLLTPLIFITAKAATIVFPPIPSSLIGIVGIPVFGWRYALFYDYVGNLLGSILAFFFARKCFGTLTARYGLGLRITVWADSLASGTLGFRSFLLIRMFTEGIFDYLSYAAGMTRITFPSYFLATALGCLPMKFLFFYFGGIAFSTSLYVTFSFVLIFGVGAALLQNHRARSIGARPSQRSRDEDTWTPS